MARHGLGIFTHEQTAGRGQRGRKWLAAKNENILVSVILDTTPVPFRQPFRLNALVALSAINFFTKYAGDECSIKWPNDIYWRERKAGGILIETMGNGKWAIAGIGININQTSFPPELLNPVSLKQITGRSFDPVALAKELVQEVIVRFDQFMNSNFEDLVQAYSSFLYKKNAVVKFKRGNYVFEARVLGITEEGNLVISHTEEETIKYGETEWLSP
jgi:BirA family biotin operon repressor/biotin-[acetyl-CoA-carboxylase] ligase